MGSVAQFTQRYIRSIIEEIWEQAQAGASAFLDALKAGRSGHWQKTSSGWLVQSSSGAGYSTNFHIPSTTDDPSGITPPALQELFQHIIENYRLVVANGLTEGEASQGNPAFLTALLALFPTIKGVQNNWAYANLA